MSCIGLSLQEYVHEPGIQLFTDRLLSQTPLNNNIRELFNLMNFLDPIEWNDLNTLEKEYVDLTEEKIKELHHKLRPYFLRRVKSEVLQLPPKVRRISTASRFL